MRERESFFGPLDLAALMQNLDGTTFQQLHESMTFYGFKQTPEDKMIRSSTNSQTHKHFCIELEGKPVMIFMNLFSKWYTVEPTELMDVYTQASLDDEIPNHVLPRIAISERVMEQFQNLFGDDQDDTRVQL